MITGNRILSRSFTDIWVDGDRVAEAQYIKINIKAQRSDVQIGIDVDSKLTGLKGEGELKLRQVYTRFYDVVDRAKKGKDVRLTIMTALKDPDSVGGNEERYRIGGIALDDIPLINYETGKINEQVIRFRFTPSSLENLASIEAVS